MGGTGLVGHGRWLRAQARPSARRWSLARRLDADGCPPRRWGRRESEGSVAWWRLAPADLDAGCVGDGAWRNGVRPISGPRSVEVLAKSSGGAEEKFESRSGTLAPSLAAKKGRGRGRRSGAGEKLPGLDVGWSLLAASGGPRAGLDMWSTLDSTTTRKCEKFAADCGRTRGRARWGRLGTASETQVLKVRRPSATLARNWPDRPRRTIWWVRRTTTGTSGRKEHPGVPERGGARSPGRPEKSAALGQCPGSEVSGGI
ncbi:skin secretory protein xP2-like [Iris pallida]|uniref:Skin secretory protein xP2-like n=1 Tax=Iris pallida TaxID=29817 RepID=A0AAX6FVS1_IRIPA|nr:skin secretory protein xP2-like [Iris pallida]